MQVSDNRKRRPELMEQCFEEIFAWHSSGRIASPKVKTLKLEEYGHALTAIRDRTAQDRMILIPNG